MKGLFGEFEKGNKYARQAIRWEDKGDHYELIFTDDFVTPSSAGLRRYLDTWDQELEELYRQIQ